MSLWSARSLVFSTSAAVLVLEILAGRLLAPYVGVSLETFTGIIGTVLAGISLGAWAGGRAADHRPPRSLLGPLLVGGGLASLASPTIVDSVGSGLRGGGPVTIVILAAFGFLLPAMLLSAVTPVVVKIRLQQLSETGSVVGAFSAVGTAGAIFGTFFTGFVLLAALPTRPIVLGLGFLLVVVGLVMMRLGSGRSILTLIFALVLAFPLSVAGGPCDVETTYYCVDIETDGERPDGRFLRLDDLRHSHVDLADPTHLEFRYIEVFADVVDSQSHPGSLDVLSIGGGGFTIPRWVSSTRPGSTNTVLELDPGLVDVAVAELGLDLSTIARVETGDARLTVAGLPQGAFDVVVGDAFGGRAVPWHLTTLEFVSEIQARLASDGVYVLNVIDRPPNRFARAEAATLLAVFGYVGVVAPSEFFADESGGNFVLVASDRPLEVLRLRDAIAERAGEESVLTGTALLDWLEEAAVLTDDFAPVDQLLSR